MRTIYLLFFFFDNSVHSNQATTCPGAQAWLCRAYAAISFALP